MIVNDERAKLEKLYILSEPLQLLTKASFREIRFVICSYDQGWSDFPQHHGTYLDSMTWFDVAIQRENQERVDFGSVDKCLTRNVHGARAAKEHWIVLRWARSSQPKCQWLDWIEPGDRIGIVPMAKYRGWVNHVESASIEIFTTHL